MKTLIFKTMAFMALSMIAVSCSSNDDMMETTNQKAYSEASKEAFKAKTYRLRFGLISTNGTKTLSGNYDVGSFIAKNTVTGEEFDTYYGGGFQSLPAYYEGVPAGTYTFTALQGQGGWVGYGTVTGTVSDAQVDADGYVTVYVPITWEE